MCGGNRLDRDFVLCLNCREKMNPRHSTILPNDRYVPHNKLFLGLHEWMIQQGKHYRPEYEI